jgi:hypothetical protein
MLNAVWAAVIVAVGCWLVLVAAAVYVLMKLGKLITQTSETVSGLRERSDEVIDRAHAAIDASAEQLTRTDAITSSMDEVTANMAELTGRVAALAPLARFIAASAGTRFARVSALVYGVRHAAELRGATGTGGRPAAGSRALESGLAPGPARASRARASRAPTSPAHASPVQANEERQESRR